jgi:peptidoglycan/xylan/chitin deacetylase (PgdA/CDA1 family)
MRLSDLSRALANGNVPNRSVVVTFDDGYADNFHNAKPMLERYDVPATIFVASGFIGYEHEFWWDELDRTLLRPGKLPKRRLRLRANGSTYKWKLGEIARYSRGDLLRNRHWRAWEEAPTSRHSLYKSLWELVQPMTETARESILDELREWAEVQVAGRPNSNRLLTLEDMRILANERLVEIGAHTVTHPRLSALPVESQRNEILGSKTYLEEILGRPISSFAYPFGRRSDYDRRTIAVVRQSGFACACCNFSGRVQRSTDPFQLPRVQVHDWGGDEFTARLSWWFES